MNISTRLLLVKLFRKLPLQKMRVFEFGKKQQKNRELLNETTFVQNLFGSLYCP